MIYKQGDPRWAKVPVGTQGGTLKGIGCLITAIAQAGYEADTSELDPGQLAKAAHLAGVLSAGGGARLPALARLVGLAAPASLRVWGPPNEILQGCIERSLVDGSLAILHVDYSDDVDSKGNHFVLGCRLDRDLDEVWYLDPADGGLHSLAFSSLSGPCGWRENRFYRVISVAPLLIP